ncbi:hypothetical protein T440DRAFT_512022 [Plenodomus tracheiphilus IPT5]|uniref:Uncharacterized protein n=1 Tax=Plenodomus tracheiphilus IPT5 TaxID=1408161 RepID=A0A6A7ANF4_9PLEO|nr:hypothetical protein T440DRAFT_512022 [Plenodomus tracheiphilus IPT5]
MDFVPEARDPRALTLTRGAVSEVISMHNHVRSFHHVTSVASHLHRHFPRGAYATSISEQSTLSIFPNQNTSTSNNYNIICIFISEPTSLSKMTSRTPVQDIFPRIIMGHYIQSFQSQGSELGQFSITRDLCPAWRGPIPVPPRLNLALPSDIRGLVLLAGADDLTPSLTPSNSPPRIAGPSTTGGSGNNMDQAESGGPGFHPKTRQIWKRQRQESFTDNNG